MAGNESPFTYAKGGQVQTFVSHPDMGRIELPLDTILWTGNKLDGYNHFANVNYFAY